MTAYIRASEIGDIDAFKKRVEAFRQAKLDHHKTEGEPAPREHELVEACVRRVPRGQNSRPVKGGAASPQNSHSEFCGAPRSGWGSRGGSVMGPAASLPARDPHPSSPFQGEEAQADDYEIVDYVIVDDRPGLRARKDALIHQVIEQERALMAASMPPGKRRLAALRAAGIRRKREAERSEADRNFLADEDARQKREAAIGRYAAEQMAAIEDLTEEMIEVWQPAPLPGIRDQESGSRAV